MEIRIQNKAGAVYRDSETVNVDRTRLDNERGPNDRALSGKARTARKVFGRIWARKVEKRWGKIMSLLVNINVDLVCDRCKGKGQYFQ